MNRNRYRGISQFNKHILFYFILFIISGHIEGLSEFTIEPSGGVVGSNQVVFWDGGCQLENIHDISTLTPSAF